MGKKKVVGICAICGEHTKLTNEHVPPKCAGNRGKTDVYKNLGKDLILNRKPDEIKQNGVTFETLCEKCNSDTGGWYVPEYCKWARKALVLTSIATRLNSSYATLHLNDAYPARFLKQVVTMFSSISKEHRGSLVSNYLLNKKSRELPEKYRYFLNLYTNRLGQYQPILAMGNISTLKQGTGSFTQYSLLSNKPFEIVWTTGISYDLQHEYPFTNEITHFASYGINERIALTMKLEVVQKTHFGRNY